MDSAFYSCVDDTIEDAFDASSDTEPADSDSSVNPNSLDLEAEHTTAETQDRLSVAPYNRNSSIDWSSAKTLRDCLSNDTALQGNTASNHASQKLPLTGNLNAWESSSETKRLLTSADDVPSNSDCSDIHQPDLSRQHSSWLPGSLYVSTCDTGTGRQSLLQSRTYSESTAESRLKTADSKLPGSSNRLASSVYLPDDKVMEIVEEQLENDDDDDDDDDDNVCVMDTKPVSDDDDNAESELDSAVEDVEEISEDDEDRLAEEERAVLEEAARAAAEAEAEAAAKRQTDASVADSPTTGVAADSAKTASSSAPCE